MTTLIRRNPSVSMLTIDAPLQPPPSPSPLRPVNTISMPPTPPATSTTTSGSLYHTCRLVLDKLATVDGLANYLEVETTTDPLSKLTSICRQGYPLCTLYNALNPATPLTVENDPTLNARNCCKAIVYHFIVACRNDLKFPEEDMFTITNLFSDDTNGFVKVVNTINKLLQILENRGIITVRSSNRNSDNSDPNAPKNTRDKVVLELLETERKYVHDMEFLQSYMGELQTQKIVSADTIHYLFGNLNTLVDFQRRFLIQLEEIAEKSPEEQRIGSLFIQMEDAFVVYEPYCANYYSALDLVVQETPNLQKLADILNPIYQLPSMLIKPVQRICKYPLLLQQLVKSTDKSWAYYEEMQRSLEVIKRVAKKVNETQRDHENEQAVQALKKRLDDWKEVTIDCYGKLMLQEKLPIFSNSADNNVRDLHVFFFEKALLLCKESKGNHLLPKSNTLSINKKKRRGSLVPKLIVQITNIVDMNSRIKNGAYSLTIDLHDHELEQLTIKFRNEERLKIWSSSLSKAIKQAIAAAETDSILSTQLSTPYTDGEDEEDVEEEYYDDEEDDFITQSRSRSSSINQQPIIRSKLGPSQMYDTPAKYNAIGRPYHNVPGMNLSPLPRSNSNLTNGSGISSSPPRYDDYYPASPPPSYPSSPTNSSRTSSNSSTWHRHDGKAFADIAANLLAGDYHPDEHYHHHLIQKQQEQQHYQQLSLLHSGRSQSHSAALEASRSHTIRPTVPTNQNRLRSQSSPNIMKDSNNIPMIASPSTATSGNTEVVPKLPTRTFDSNKPAPLDLSRQYNVLPQIIRSVASTPRLTDIAMAHGAPLSPGIIDIKLNFNDGVYTIFTSNEVTFLELIEKVDKKIRIVGNLKPSDLLRLKYKDEDSDFITINSDDDVQMAFESRSSSNTVNLFVSL